MSTESSTAARSDDNLNTIRDAVRVHYAAAARSVSRRARPASSGCCGGAASQPAMLQIADYDPDSLRSLPQEAVLASLGCGNPTALAALHPGETVLDLGSGGGIDVLLSAKRVGPTGFAFGLDMTDEMLALAERNAAQAGVANVRFLKGHIEEIPLPDASVDVIISNCVINLSGDKEQVLREAYRVLRHGGRFAVSDIVIEGVLPAEVRQSFAAWSACVAGALTSDEYRSKLAGAGFAEIEVEPTHTVALDEMTGCCGDGCCGDASADTTASTVDPGTIISAFIRARKV